jgi:hypothetical protein
VNPSSLSAPGNLALAETGEECVNGSMSSSLFLFLDTEGRSRFDEAKLRNLLMNLQRISNWREEIGSGPHGTLFDCLYEFNEDCTTIFVPTDLSFISIWGRGEASLHAALEIQKGYNAPIYIAVSEVPDNIANLSSVSSLAELRDRLKR